MPKAWRSRASNLNAPADSLSGGNQQKVVISKWLMSQPKVLIMDDPTRGIDVGTKYEIYKIMNDLSEKGIAIIMISSDLEEVLGMSDRIMVMHEDRSVCTLDIAEATQEKIMALATGTATNSKPERSTTMSATLHYSRKKPYSTRPCGSFAAISRPMPWSWR